MLGEELNWFTTLAEMERVRGAAERLHITQPTLSRMLARLERRLGVELFDRKGRRITLNAFGRVYYDHVRRAQAELDVAERELAMMAHPAGGAVRLAFGHSFGSWPVPQLIADFQRTAGRISFTLQQGSAEDITALVIEHDADLAIVSPRPVTPGLGWRPLAWQRLALAVAPQHRLAGRRQVRLSELAGSEFVALHPGFGMRRIFDELCAAADFRPHIAFEVGELDTMAALVAAGLGIAVLPYGGAPGCATVSPPLVMVPLADEGVVREVGIVWAATAVPSGAALRFRDFAAEWAGHIAGISTQPPQD
ncbi:LysR family transcriptional regulator [Nocardia canadensis]|uniref:LysR family transcriptional regulator n=1 Tax=Nocardia canadensis TaxID=3065238 RepID=UPI002931A54A|nr:LysR family transcriptional regulator [Nocardia canadensis]